MTGTELTLDALRAKKKPNSKTVPIAGDSEAAERLEEAQEVVKAAEASVRMAEVRNHPETMERVQEELAVAKIALRARLEEIQASLIMFRFQAIGPKKWDDVVNDHEMNEERRKEVLKQNPKTTDEELAVWDPDTFPRGLIAACMVEPPLSQEDAYEWLNDATWNNAEITTLFMACLEVNNTRKIVELGKG